MGLLTLKVVEKIEKKDTNKKLKVICTVLKRTVLNNLNGLKPNYINDSATGIRIFFLSSLSYCFFKSLHTSSMTLIKNVCSDLSINFVCFDSLLFISLRCYKNHYKTKKIETFVNSFAKKYGKYFKRKSNCSYITKFTSSLTPLKTSMLTLKNEITGQIKRYSALIPDNESISSICLVIIKFFIRNVINFYVPVNDYQLKLSDTCPKLKMLYPYSGKLRGNICALIENSMFAENNENCRALLKSNFEIHAFNYINTNKDSFLDVVKELILSTLNNDKNIVAVVLKNETKYDVKCKQQLNEFFKALYFNIIFPLCSVINYAKFKYELNELFSSKRETKNQVQLAYADNDNIENDIKLPELDSLLSSDY